MISAVVVATLAVTCSAKLAVSAQLQWGFDFTSGTVASQNGGVIVNDGTAGASLDGQAGIDVPVYSSDIPTSAQTQFVTGIGSVDVSSGGGSSASIKASGTTSNLGSNADLVAAGGLTTEIWVKRLGQGSFNDERVFQIGNDWFGLTITNTTVFGINATSAWPHPVYTFPTDTETDLNNKWTHLALTYDVEPGVGDDIFTLYIDGAQVAQTIGTGSGGTSDFIPNLDGGAANFFSFGNNETGGKGFNGLIYEPRVTLGVLSPSEFTVKAVPEPTALVLLSLGLFGLAGFRRR